MNRMSLFRRAFQWPVFIVLFALVFRIVLIIALETYHKDPTRDHWTFGFEVGRVAKSIASGRGFSSPFDTETGPTAFYTPLYPYLVAGVFKLFGIYSDASCFVLLALNSLFSALTCLNVLRLGQRTFGRTVANLSAWSWALHPLAIHISIRWIWEMTLSTFLLSLLVLWTLDLWHSRRYRPWLTFGLLCALTALSNPVSAAVLPFLWAWLWVRLRSEGALPNRLVGMAVLVFLVSLVPWSVRNYLTFHRFVPFRSNLSLELQVGNNPAAFGRPVFSYHPAHSDAELEIYRRIGEMAYMAEKKRQVLQFIDDNPGSFVRLTLQRIAYFWTGTWQFYEDNWFAPWVSGIEFFYFSLESFLAFLGLVLLFRRGRKEALPFAAVLLSYPLAYYVTHVELRYRLAVEPMMVVLGAYALCEALGAKRTDLPAPTLTETTAGR